MIRELILIRICWFIFVPFSFYCAMLKADYVLVPVEINLPGADTTVRSFSFFNDGRLLVFSEGKLYVEDIPGSENLMLMADLSITSSAVFLSISDNQQKIAIGTSGTVHIYEVSNGQTIAYSIAAFDAVWFDDRYLLVNSSPFDNGEFVLRIRVLDTLSLPSSPSYEPLIVDIPGAQAGIAFDHQKNLVVGRFDQGVGNMRFFERSLWEPAFLAQSTINHTMGVELGTYLTAANIGFDVFGHFHIGGGNLPAGLPQGVLISSSMINTIIQGSKTAFTSGTVPRRVFNPPSHCPVNHVLIDSDHALGRIGVSCYASNQIALYNLAGHYSVPIHPAFVGLMFVIISLMVKNDATFFSRTVL